jgi:hypothetical protein
VCLVEIIDGAVHGSMLAQHVPDNWEVSAEDATEGFEDGVCAEGNVVPCEVWTASAKDNGETDRGYDAGSMSVVSRVSTFCAEETQLTQDQCKR